MLLRNNKIINFSISQWTSALLEFLKKIDVKFFSIFTNHNIIHGSKHKYRVYENKLKGVNDNISREPNEDVIDTLVKGAYLSVSDEVHKAVREEKQRGDNSWMAERKKRLRDAETPLGEVTHNKSGGYLYLPNQECVYHENWW